MSSGRHLFWDVAAAASVRHSFKVEYSLFPKNVFYPRFSETSAPLSHNLYSHQLGSRSCRSGQFAQVGMDLSRLGWRELLLCVCNYIGLTSVMASEGYLFILWVDLQSNKEVPCLWACILDHQIYYSFMSGVRFCRRTAFYYMACGEGQCLPCRRWLSWYANFWFQRPFK